MPMLIIGGGDAYPETKTPTGRKSFLRRVQTAIIICTAILLFTLVLFILCAIDPSKVSEEPWRINGSGPRMLVRFPYRQWNALQANNDVFVKSSLSNVVDHVDGLRYSGVALEGMGTLFRKPKRAMHELVVAHLSDSSTAEDLRLFLRGLHRSGIPARADVVLLFPWRPLPLEFADVIYEEERYFERLIAKYQKIENRGGVPKPLPMIDTVQDPSLSIFNSVAYSRTPLASDIGKGRQESMWGIQDGNDSSARVNDNNVHNEEVNYGAIVGFDMLELDPDDALSSFLDLPFATLRRWVCYQMLLGMLRHHYRHVFLTEVSGVFIMKDILAPLKKKDTTLHLYHTGQRWVDVGTQDVDVSQTQMQTQTTQSNSDLDETLNSSKSSVSSRRFLKELGTGRTIGIVETVYGKEVWSILGEEDKERKVISTGVILGGIRAVRSVATAMATEIVRVALLRKNRTPFRDEAILSFLVHKSSVLGRKVACHLQLHDNGESSVNILPGPPRPNAYDDFFRRFDSEYAVLHGLKDKSVGEERRRRILQALRNDICGSQDDIAIYTDCHMLPATRDELTFS